MNWNHVGSLLKVTLYPMIHIGSASFYASVSDELARFDVALVEGVSWRRRPAKLYDLLASNVGLSSQSQALRYPPHLRRINIDMPREQFRRRFFAIPLRYRAMLQFFRPLSWLLTLFPEIRTQLLLTLVEKDANEYRRRRTPSALRRLVIDERDEVIVSRLEKFYADNVTCRDPTRAAIVFGAGHMPAITSKLTALGFRPATRRWLDVLCVGDAF